MFGRGLGILVRCNIAQLVGSIMKSVVEVVGDVHEAATNLGMDLSPKDTAFIIASFLECMADNPVQPGVNEWLLMIASEVNSVRDE